MFKKVLFLSVSLSLLACSNAVNNTYQEELSGIDRMLNQLDSLEQSFAAVDRAELEKELVEVDSLYGILTASHHDQKDKKFWTQTMATIAYVKQPYEKFARDADKIAEGLTLSTKQLKSLRNSIEDAQLDSTKVSEYYFTESKAFKDLILLHRKRVGPAKTAVAIWDTAAATYLQLAAKNDSLAL